MGNWLVCLAVWLSKATNTLPGKALAVLPPISMFVAIGLEHSVANMYALRRLFYLLRGCDVAYDWSCG